MHCWWEDSVWGVHDLVWTFARGSASRSVWRDEVCTLCQHWLVLLLWQYPVQRRPSWMRRAPWTVWRRQVLPHAAKPTLRGPHVDSIILLWCCLTFIWWRGLAVTHCVEWTKFLYGGPFFISSEHGQTSTSCGLLTSGCGRAGSAECITKMSKCRTVVLTKMETDVSGSSWKGRDSLSLELVEYIQLVLRWVTVYGQENHLGMKSAS